MGFGKSTLYSILPPGTRYRELWLPELINNHATLPSSIAGGHSLTLSGARKGTTVDGVHGDGSATSNINCGAIHTGAAKLWISFRFKLDQVHDNTSGDEYLFGKRLDGANRWFIVLSGDGVLRSTHRVAAGDVFSCAAQDGGVPITSWEAGRWYHVLASMSDDGATQVDARLIIDNGTVVTDADAGRNVLPAGDLCFLNDDDPGVNPGFPGVIADIVIGTDDLTPTEEYELYAGIPPADAVNSWLLDEGRGVTAYDRGTGGNNGTLDTAATWAWGSCKHPVLSLDGINDVGISSIGVDISGDLTWVWVGKMKSTYSGLSGPHYFFRIYIDVDNLLHFRYDPNLLRYRVKGTRGTVLVTILASHNIDDYLIFIGTLTLAGSMELFSNGLSVGTNTGAGIVSGAAATAYIGRQDGLTEYDLSKPLLVGLIDGAFTERQARIFSKNLNSMLGLGLAI